MRVSFSPVLDLSRWCITSSCNVRFFPNSTRSQTLVRWLVVVLIFFKYLVGNPLVRWSHALVTVYLNPFIPVWCSEASSLNNLCKYKCRQVFKNCLTSGTGFPSINMDWLYPKLSWVHLVPSGWIPLTWYDYCGNKDKPLCEIMVISNISVMNAFP